MAESVKCVGCPAILSNPTYPEYKVNVTGHVIRPKARCNKCRSAYEALMLNKPVGGLTKLSAVVFFLFSLLSLSSCAPYGPWPFSTQEQRDRYLTVPGQTVDQVQERNGPSHVDPNFNPACPTSFKRLPSDYTGVAYFKLTAPMTRSDEAIEFVSGVAVRVWYVRAPWNGYDTWQKHELVWDKE